ncbi:TPM domain-containing protein [Quisquiliibacterium transsilvanicum]|uniref:Putative membrane protein n=1 Tax=Quisquiliibacterium transsilvanicum TaxID=1549638 RepID=A0A7W8M912_9BURK|nr:TPM domain-containing protein [Quisquiliibacterium transsilvanicum]MBB5272202.1 putative membrane protein [Quisquiliibacterium transsilvanicum]
MQRFLRHLWIDRSDLARAFPPQALERIEHGVVAGETRHSAELRLAIEASLPLGRILAGDTARERALEVFGNLRVWDTENNNGVLLYVLYADHSVEIVADRAASRAIPDHEWRAVAEELARAYLAGDFVEGTLAAVARLDALLEQAFPPGADNPDELLNRPVML